MNRSSAPVVRMAVLLASSVAIPIGTQGIAAPSPTPIAAFDTYVEQEMHRWGVPGVAVALIQDGKIVAAKGYGLRKLGDSTLVDKDTVFAVASVTKSFTAAVVATLVDEHKLTWDDLVKKYLPDLQLIDPRLTDELTIRDLLAQRTCIESKNLLTWNSPLNRAQVIQRMRYLKQVCRFRSRFEYNNLNFMLAGAVAESASGQSWQQLVQERIFRPLGMRSSTVSSDEAAKNSNLATPYIKISGKLRALPLFDEGPTAAAGSIHSSAQDMAQYLKAQLDQGKFGVTRLWSEESAHEMHEPQMVIPSASQYAMLWPEAQFLSYGFGWFTYSLHGHKIVEHGGQSDGMQAIISMMPDARNGIVVLTNTSMLGFAQAVVYRWYESNLGLPDRDWGAEFLARFKPLNDSIDLDAVTKNAPHVAGTHPSLQNTGYVGSFHNDLLGELKIAAIGKSDMTITLLGRSGHLHHWHYDTFRIDWGGDVYLTLDEPFVTFALDAAGRPSILTMSSEDQFSRSGEGAAAQ